MVETLNSLLSSIASVVWGPFLLIPLLLGTGVYLTVRLAGLQFRALGRGLKHTFASDDSDSPGDISNYQALTTALAATVGTGNIVGVATAIALGGPGALLWIWITGLVGMASKYTEAYLGVRFRITDKNGAQMGGPQIYLRRGIPGTLGKVLALSFAIFATIASFGIGNLTQGNSVAAGMEDTFGVDPWVTGVIMFVALGAVLLGGIQGIGKITAAFVPLMIVIYVTAGIVALILMADQIPAALASVFTSAFSGSAAAGGFLGATIMMAVRYGVARGIFSNESGMGSAAIAAAAAKTSHPTRQGLVSMTQTFIDTMIVVSITGLVIVTSGVWQQGADNAATMTSAGFATVLPGEWGGTIVSVSLIFFAFSTILGWSYYGERTFVSLVGTWGSLPYRMVFTCVVFLSAITEIELAWTFSDLANGLMALPNLIGLIILSGLVARETKAYLEFDPQLNRPKNEVDDFIKQQGMDWK